MIDQADSQSDILQALDSEVRRQCEIAGMVLQDEPNGVTLVNPTTGTQLALKYNPDHIMLSYHSKTRHGTPYIAYERSAEGMMLRIRHHNHLMHADQVAEYLVDRLLRDEMP